MNGNMFANLFTAPTRRKIVLGSIIAAMLGMLGILDNISLLGLNRTVPLGNLMITWWGLIVTAGLGISLYWIWIGRIR